jgi:uncharacterized membrane protein (DUF4010 family)
MVVLPLLPAGPFGPYSAIRPRELWTIVLLISGLNFLGYLARRAVGPERGYGVTGLLGGLVSSTAVALTFAQKSREESGYARSLALGVVAACTVLIPRVLGITLVLSPPVAGELVLYVLPPLLVGGLFIVWFLRPSPPEPTSPPEPEANPLGLLSAIKMVVALAARAIAVGLLANTALKLTLVVSLGSPAFRRAAAPGLLALGVAVVTGLALLS